MGAPGAPGDVVLTGAMSDIGAPDPMGLTGTEGVMGLTGAAPTPSLHIRKFKILQVIYVHIYI
jgi:hypothetical protein